MRSDEYPAGDVRVGVDIGGTFTDIAVQIGSRSSPPRS
jgi:hypothetical protein